MRPSAAPAALGQLGPGRTPNPHRFVGLSSRPRTMSLCNLLNLDWGGGYANDVASSLMFLDVRLDATSLVTDSFELECE